MDGQESWWSDKIDSVVGELERLNELNRQPRRHEVSDRAVDPGPVRPNIDSLLDERVRNASLKVESGQQVIRETADCRSNDQRAEIATDGRLREALVTRDLG